MSAYSGGRNTPQLFTLPGALKENSFEADLPPVPESGAGHALFNQLDGLAHSLRQLESALHVERNRSRKLQEELHATHSHYDQTLRDKEAQVRELAAQEARTRLSLSQLQAEETKTREQGRQLTLAFEKIRNGLYRYKAAWADVLDREREAKLILSEAGAMRARSADLDSRVNGLQQSLDAEKTRRAQLERHTKSYQDELQSALLRIHSSESKFSQLSKEHELLAKTKRNFDEEVAKIEKTMWERFQWTMIKEREKIRAEVEKEAAIEREQAREVMREGLRAETSKEILAERERASKRIEELQNDFATIRSRLEQAETLANEKTRVAERAQTEAAELKETLERLMLGQVQRDEELLKLRSSFSVASEKLEALGLDREQFSREAEKYRAEYERLVCERDDGLELIQNREAELREALAALDATKAEANHARAQAEEAREKFYVLETESEADAQRAQERASRDEEGRNRLNWALGAVQSELQKLKSMQPLRSVFDQRELELHLLESELAKSEAGSEEWNAIAATIDELDDRQNATLRAVQDFNLLVDDHVRLIGLLPGLPIIEAGPG